ncbi:exodeoxyribonuclease V subunit beta [Geoalkalibacter halelectricus]|uniref:exodeoxyribonuclease V subunit beta n=1 Tax=Geoalkalibacter halelectricus TaxID=2847045 RepID=UPI003D1E9C8A
MNSPAREFDLTKAPLAGRNLIEASAGTGKTYAIAGIYLRLVVEAGLGVEQILVVTFTEAATEELRDRLRERLRGALAVFCGAPSEDPLLCALYAASSDRRRDAQRLRDALTCFDEAAIFTIHGFCHRTLQEKVFESGGLFETELVTEQDDLLRDTVEDFWRRHFIQAEPRWLGWSQSRGAHPAGLWAFVKDQGKAADLRVIPAASPVEDAELVEELDSAFTAASDAWSRWRDEVLELLLTSPALNRNSYRTASIPAWGEQLSNWFAAGEALAPLDILERFTTAKLAASLKKNQTAPQHPFFDLCDALSSARAALEEVWGLRLMALKGELLDWLRQELPRRKRRLNLRAFDDLLLDLRAALQREGGAELARELRRRYPAALIDEFQDTDPVQYAIFRAIYPSGDNLVCLIGDPKQAIYSFRGADIFAYLAAAGEVENRYTLKTNWRSDAPLVRAVNRVFSRCPRPFVFDEIAYSDVDHAPGRDASTLLLDGRPAGAALRLWFMERGGEKKLTVQRAVPQLAEAVAGEIARLLDLAAQGRLTLEGRPVRPGDMAVLVRANYQARLVQQALRARRIPSVLYSSESLFAAPEMAELHLVLTAVADPAGDAALRAALGTQLLGYDAAGLEAATLDEARWDALCERFIEYHELWASRGFIAMTGALLGREQIRARLLAHDDGERRLTNLLHGIEVLHQAAVENRLGMDGLLTWLGTRLVEKPVRDVYQLRLETDEDAVKLVTIHRSKGLEYPIVFCPFNWKGASLGKGQEVRFHDPAARRALTLDLGSPTWDEHKRLAEQELLAENLRLLYVALTRARNHCTLVWGAFNQGESSALAYLFHQPPDTEGASLFPDQLGVHVQTLDDDALRADLRALEGEAGADLEVATLPAPGAHLWQPADQDRGEPRCRTFQGRIAADWRIASFSSLTAKRGESIDLPDRDVAVVTADEALLPVRPPFTDILDFPRGARAGSCLHEIFEEVDFGAAAAPRARDLVGRKLHLYGFDAQWTAAVHAMVARVLETPLPGAFGPLRLAEIPRAERLAELEFHFPVTRLTAPGLSEILARHFVPAADVAPDLSPAPLDFTALHGYVKGYIDLVFCRDGRYYILDWKSNYLGPQRGDYRRPSLTRAMVRDAYVLQYHLYSLALHRWLRARLPGYDYETHFGGVFYLFVRGIGAPGGEGCGIYHDRPARRLILDLDGFLGGAP